MRLIDVRTLEIKTFGDKPPPYAILSHKWGAEEVTYQEFVAHQKQNGKGYQKILDFCRTVQERAVKWAWIDTCCIDKTSSAELSEAINSMWHYYRGAAYCIAYLEDVSSLHHINDMYKSEWFTRGWTLQELLAPRLLAFCSSDWSRIGSMRDSAVVRAIVTRVTGIHTKYLTNHNSISNASVARRMSWAARRKTTREEDMAFCLMGLFNVHMSLLYGEGGRNAFYRLQKKIIKQSNDESIFAFNANHIGGILAARPTAFRDSGPVPEQGASSDCSPET
ncbi:hypothetical protein M409DRAFT_68112 [Zasmidium cellare ATCC 36951]|uniref:Heterokaryon incompatibility domain-containing protein n=1 Tax=Zasmidium cellare ATCC 36951 TaxID=1080233 RepID=A0A6A6CAN7_ZASCE|nr:uncharacterized protein M409DRAFT_68112 [Zasmidium cellare ATCC 36951]KAF2164257.1 hypothetical protein M409DRAFT_68112 [Zasmidium cellare ATCC 36951]